MGRLFTELAKTGENSCASRNFCGGKSILKRDRRKKNDESRFIELRGRNISRDKETGRSVEGVVLGAEVALGDN